MSLQFLKKDICQDTGDYSHILRKIRAKKVIWSFIVGGLLFLFLITFPNGAFLIADRNFLRMYTKEGDLCIPKRHVMFLKTHKCGSSTVQNVFLRYGFKNNLTFALPPSGNYIGNPSRFKASMIPPSRRPENGLFDIFCMHSRLNETEMKKVLHPDTVWVTLVRDPVKLFESLYNFFHLNSIYRMPLEAFGNHDIKSLEKITRKGPWKFGKNQILFDLGSDENITMRQLSQKLKDLDQLFDLVMISEKMEESLILLRHKLCWSLEDVVVFKKNARRENTKEKLTEATIQKIRDLNTADVILYDYFTARHRENVYKFGEERMRREVSALRELTDEYYDHCVNTEVNGKDVRLQFPEYSNLVNSFILNNETEEVCRTLTMPELHFVDLVRQRQFINVTRKPVRTPKP